MNSIRKLPVTFLKKPLINPTFSAAVRRRLSTKSGDDEWNDAWESAWLPDDLSGKNRAPWEADVNFALPDDTNNTTENTQNVPRVSEVDAETKAFVEDMNENWHLRKGKQQKNSTNDDNEKGIIKMNENESSLYSLENVKRDYRLKKQRIHAGLWLKEIDKMEEAKLGDSIGGNADDIEKLLDSCSEIFDSPNDDLSNSNITNSEFKNKPDGWETTSKTQDGNIWEMSQREEDILVQEFERRIAFNKFQIASFIKTHIFSRRRPIDGWKYMIEEIGPNAKKGKGSVSRLPSIADASTRPFREEVTSSDATFPSNRGRTGR
ncbi:PREDICTED: uncharacterized protein LOC109219530 [Nicotiana attenuata]|uniref:Mucin-related protein n=1 Tax=Nicotiana attenuata TaxID=49451 RepID=A0A1J6K7C2_NICAT|nr:PREDICTED: uncharacterized protein LOC109219530 [Nicotiana attenuata]OIT20944.1 hypothetical protein A4A49_37531 [Nicotiana attenuata]